MNVYLLPHHRLDPRFRYTLEREAAAADGAADGATPVGWLRRLFAGIRQSYRKLKYDYDQVVHGHEQIRLSRLVLMMDRDPELTLVIPAGMGRDSALEAVRGVIRSGMMALRSHAIRNVITAVVMMIVLFGATPTHVAAVIFYPLIALYAWGRYWEDRLIRRTMNHLLDQELAGNGNEHFRDEEHLARLEQLFRETPRPDAAYRAAVRYLDELNGQLDSRSSPQHLLMYKYYTDIGRIDPYERYQDRIRKKLVETAKLVAHHLWAFWRAAFRWSFATTRIAAVRLPNLLFVLLGALGTTYGAIEYFEWKNQVVETYPKFVHATVTFPEDAKIIVEAWPLKTQQGRGTGENADAPPSAVFDLSCPIDSGRIDLWSVISDMIAKHEKKRSGELPCSEAGDATHGAKFAIRVKY